MKKNLRFSEYDTQENDMNIFDIRKDDRDDDGEQRKKQHQDEVKYEYRLRGSAVYAALAYLMPDYGKRISAHVTAPPCSSVSGN